MNCDKATAQSLAGGIAEAAGDVACDLLVCPPFTALAAVAGVVDGSAVLLGGQDCHEEDSGAYTGNVSARMLTDIGCSDVILGHSERRALQHESSELVQSKTIAAHRAGLRAIVCVGESESERDAGEALATVAGQLEGSIPADADTENTVVAYEPVWAIGTGRTPVAAEIVEMHAHIRQTLSNILSGKNISDFRLLYGGSVNPGNAGEILSLDGVNGALVGGASLEPASFLDIARSCP